MKKTMKRLLASVLSVCLAAAVFTGCQQSGTESTVSKTESGTASDEKKEVVTIDYYGRAVNSINDYFEWQQKYMEEKIGVHVNVLPVDNEKFQPMLAAGNLPDVGEYSTNGDPHQVIAGGHVMDLTSHLDKLDNWVKNWPESVQYSKDYLSDGTGKVYAVLTQQGTYDNFPLNVGCYAANVRWDIYEKAGKPKVTDMDSYLDALLKMKEVYPETEEGLPTYGMSLFPDWDSTQMACANKYTTVMGIMEYGIGYNLYDIVNDKISPMLEKGSLYYDALKWLNKANRMGLVDPDSMTQNFDNANAKAEKSGQALSSMWGSYCDAYNTKERNNAENPQGYMPLIWKGQYPSVCEETSYVGSKYYARYISSTTEKLDACLTYLNLQFDDEANMFMYAGPEGDLWEMKDGKFSLTDAAYEFQKTTGSHTFSTGEACTDWYCPWGLQAATVSPKYKAEYSIKQQVPYAEKTIEDNKIVDMYEKVYGTRRPIEVWRENNAICYRPTWLGFVEAKSDKLLDIENNIKGGVVESSWKLVMNAKTDEEFDKMYDDMKKAADALGLQELVDWGQAAIGRAKEAAAKYERK